MVEALLNAILELTISQSSLMSEKTDITAIKEILQMLKYGNKKRYRFYTSYRVTKND